MPKKKNQSKPPVEKVDFPVEDQGWIALQLRIIELAGKPVEDLEWNDVAKVSKQLAPSEQDTLRKYWLRLKQEQENTSQASTSKPSTGVSKWANWEDQSCNKDLEWMLDFQNYMRAILVRLVNIGHQQEVNSYAHVLEAMKKELIEWLPADALAATKGSDIVGLLASNLSNVFPTDEGYELLKGFYERLDAREGELNKERAMAVTASHVLPAIAATPNPKPESKPQSKGEERMTREGKSEELFTMSQAMDAFYSPDGVDEETANLERAFLGVSFLLDYLSESGNESVNAIAAQGLGRCLFAAAQNMARLRNRTARAERESEAKR